MIRFMTKTISFSEGGSPGNLRPDQPRHSLSLLRVFTVSVKTVVFALPIECIAQTWHKLVSVLVYASVFFFS